uniref:Glucagon / GIP / secretin / VIP family domain-containing protein n=1 Tax=Hippocampus comes TaxID=109280 RepID=A0A3Q2XSY9_HIPCM
MVSKRELLDLLSVEKVYPCSLLSPVRWHSYQMEKGQNIIENYKRHSEGTFANDLTGHLDKMKAKDFVAWLTTTKRER